nr:hypothetical protein [Intrasporangium calvum]
MASGFRNVPGHGAVADADARRVVVGNRKLMADEGVQLGDLLARRDELASAGLTAVLVGVDGRAMAVIGLADAARETSAGAIPSVRELGAQVVRISAGPLATTSSPCPSLPGCSRRGA